MKFRTWCKRFNEWEKDLILLGPNEEIFHFNGRSCGGLKQVRPDTHIVQYSTGVFDSNGKEVFVGDIIKFEYDANMLCLADGTRIMGFSTVRTGEIERQSEIREVRTDNLQTVFTQGKIGGMGNESWTVVGNIFENKDLSKNTAQ